MRSVAYREFIYFVYGYIGKTIIPLPTCAYDTMRRKFQTKEKVKDFVGFVYEVMED